MSDVNAKFTFGLELEVVKLSDQSHDIIARRGFTRRFDRTIKGHEGQTLPENIDEGGGCELIRRPIEIDIACDQDGRNMRINWNDAEDIVRDLAHCAREVNSSCGLHVHLGRPDRTEERSKWNPEQVRTMLTIGTRIEDKLMDLVPESRRRNEFAARISEKYTEDDLCSYYPMGEVHPRKYDNPKRYCWLNLIETARRGTSNQPGRANGPATGTIEIRLLGNVRRFNYMWAWTQLWCKIGAIVAYCPSSLAINHCQYKLTADFDNVKRIKNSPTLVQPEKKEKSSAFASAGFAEDIDTERF